MNDSEEVIQLFEGKKLPWLLGSDRFIHWLKDKFFDQKDHEEVPESRALAPYRKEIKEAELYNTINLVKLRLEPWPRPGIGV